MKAVRGLRPDGGEEGDGEMLLREAEGERERPPSLSYPEVSSSVPLLKPVAATEKKRGGLVWITVKNHNERHTNNAQSYTK